MNYLQAFYVMLKLLWFEYNIFYDTLENVEEQISVYEEQTMLKLQCEMKMNKIP